MIGYPLFKVAAALMATLALASCAPPKPIATTATPAEIQRAIADSADAPLAMVHVWATWCDPCREEFPEVVKVVKRFPALDVILVSADDPTETAAVEAFLSEHESPAGSLISTELNEAFITALSPNWAGALPATFFFMNGKLVSEWEGKRTFDEYERTIETLLKN